MPEAAQETLQRYAKLLDENSGIFASLREYQLPWESPIHVCAAELKPEFRLSRYLARPAISAAVCGAGSSSFQARLSCLSEALERRSGIFCGDEPRRAARYAEIAEEAVHPDTLTLFSESQYHHRDQWNQREGRHNWVPERYSEERSIDWSPAWSLTRQQVRFLPTAYCYFGYPFDSAHDFCRPDSNGNAAGHDLNDAIVHGFLEVVERDCAAIWWYNRLRRPRVDIESFALPYTAAVCNLYAGIGRSVEVVDISTDKNVPTFVAVSRSKDPPREDYTLGFGAHFDPERALAKALTEMTQFLPIVVSERDPMCFLSADAGRTDVSFLMPDEQAVATVRSDFSSSAMRKQNVLSCIERVSSWGLEMLVLDQTREDIGMPVVKVVVPGMRSWWARFAAGRLYTLPVQIGWLDRPRSEADLNPSHLIL